MGRSLRHLIDTVRDLDERKIGLRSLQDAVDTSSPSGRLMFHLFAVLAEFERDLIRERTLAGLAAARARGRVGGRKPKMTPQKLATARQLMEARDLSMEQIAAVIGVARGTLYRHIKPVA